ncbi:hypothetical protein GCM10009113_10230 [Marinobacter szutsaonensis]
MWGRQGAGEEKAGIVQVCREDCEAAETRIKSACLRQAVRAAFPF